jgi:hypothetical protein
MNTEIKEEWVRRLRSGEYQQGHGRLTKIKPDGVKTYCCLGVLCEMAVEAGIVASSIDDGSVVYGAFREQDVLPEPVEQWAGLEPNGSDVTIVAVGQQCPDRPADYDKCTSETCPVCRDLTLIHLNDNVFSTFPEIANVIERWL